MTTYYHVSLDIDNSIDTFTPRRPSMIYSHENEDRERICLAPSIDGCLSAVPWGGIEFEETSSEFYSLNEDNLQMAFRVYEFSEDDIQEGNLINTDTLLNEGLVMDACNSKEVWVVNQTLKPSKSYIVILTDYTEGVGDVYYPEYYHLTDEEMDNADIDDYTIGCSTIIYNLSIEPYQTIEDIPYDIKWDKWNDYLNAMREGD